MDFSEFLTRENVDEVCLEEKTLSRLQQANECFASRLWAESTPNTELDIVVDQLLVSGNLICADFLPPAEFPWHKHSFDDFSELNNQMVDCLDAIEKCKSLEEAELFKRCHSVVYDVYLKNPIQVERMEEGRYKLLRDGRHRVLLATLNNNRIPVQVVGVSLVRDMTEDFFRKHCDYGTWQFGTIKTTAL